MGTSLDKLVNNLSKDAFSNLKRYYAEDILNLLTRKRYISLRIYEFTEKVKRNSTTTKTIYSRLNDEGIRDENYAHAQKVWKTFEMKNLED